MVLYSAPGKIILFGEHAVVYGKPAIAIAVEKRVWVKADHQKGKLTKVNGYPINREHHSYIMEALDLVGIKESLSMETGGDLPSGSGLGSSASVTVATLAALHSLNQDQPSMEDIAKEGFEIELKVQGSASPIDTSTVTHGGGIMLYHKKRGNFLWKIEKEDRFWNVHSCQIPEMSLVVGHTGIHASTPPLVRKVRKFYERSGFAREVVEEIGEIVEEGVIALERGDLEAIGKLMDRDHNLLKILGVSHPMLDTLVKGVKKYSYGAKLTGAGGGGAMIALTDEPNKVAQIIQKWGGKPFIVEPACKGVIRED